MDESFLSSTDPHHSPNIFFSNTQYKKSKSSKKGKITEYSSLFQDRETNITSVDTKTSVSPKIAISATNIESAGLPKVAPGATQSSSTEKKQLMSQNKPLQSDILTTENDLFGTYTQEGDWEDSFFKDPFSSSPFKDPSDGDDEDAFGFSETKVTANLDRFNTDGFFDDSGADAWGEPSSRLPVDFTPRRNNATLRFLPQDVDSMDGRPSGKKDTTFDNSDAMSYDASDMSEVTNPTFASSAMPPRPDPEGDNGSGSRSTLPKNGKGGGTVASSFSTGKSNHNRESSQGSSSMEQSESAIPLLTDSDFSKKGGSSSDSAGGAESQSSDLFSKKAVDASATMPEVDSGVEHNLFQEKENYSSENDADTLTTLPRVNKLSPSYGSDKRGVIDPFKSDDPPLNLSMESLESSDDEKDENVLENISHIDSKSGSSFVARSRILSKYSKNGKLIKPNRADNRYSLSQKPQQNVRGNYGADPVLTQIASPMATPKQNEVAKPVLKNDQKTLVAPVIKNESVTRVQPAVDSTKGKSVKSGSKIQPMESVSAKLAAKNAASTYQHPGQIKNPPLNDSLQAPSVGRYRRRQDALRSKKEPTSFSAKSKTNENARSACSTSHVAVKPKPIDSSQPTRNIGPSTSSSGHRQRRRGSPRTLETASGNMSPSSKSYSGKSVVSSDSRSRGSNKNKYFCNPRKKKNAPSVVDNPNYYSVSLSS